VTRSSRATLQPLQQHLAEQLERAPARQLEEERQHREAEAWWDSYDRFVAAFRRGERA
jgi:hypothetical protein